MINDSINRFLGVICYPFTSLDFFYEDKLRDYIAFRNKRKLGINEDNAKEEAGRKKSIKDDVIQYVGRNSNIYSYDEISLYCEQCFFYQEAESNHEFYVQLFENFASSFISQRNGKIVFKYWQNEKDKELLGGFGGNNKIYLFHSLMRHIPLDFIVMVYMNRSSGEENIYSLDGYYGNIEVADQLLSKVLQKGVAENHLHSGVSRTFLSIWDKLMEYATKGDAYLKLILPMGNKTLITMDELNFYVNVCRLIRICIALEIENHHKALEKSESEELFTFLKQFRSGKTLKEFYEKRFKEKTEEIAGYMQTLWETVLEQVTWNEKRDCNMIRTIFGVGSQIKTYDEIIFLYKAMRHYLSPEKDEKEKMINDLILQYLRVRNFIFHMSIQQKTIKGLDYFQVEKYSWNSKLNQAKNENFWEQAIRAQFQNTDLMKVEFRLSLQSELSSLKNNVREFLKAYLHILQSEYCIQNKDQTFTVTRSFPKVGLVFHLLKRYDDTIPEKCIAQGNTDSSKLQYGSLQEDYLVKIQNLLTLRKENPALTRYLVGIDAASLENSTPIWTFVPIFEKARDSTVEPIGVSAYSGCSSQSLGFTFHAGEDFRHILSGLRRMDEVVTNLKFHAGDRIGHGTAIGVNARQWKLSNPIVVMPRIELLDNYLWAYHILSHNYTKFEAPILAYMEELIYKTAKAIYGTTQGLTTSVLIDGYLDNFNIDTVSNLCENAMASSFCEEQKENKIIWDSRKLTFARHCRCYVSKMYYPVSYEVTEEDIRIIEELQGVLQKKLSRQGIVIEINPSSNLVIGDIDKVTENQIYKISHIEQGKDNILSCINSDDPTVFNTNVSNELAFIYYGMLEQGVGKETAIAWIEKLRKNGIEASFLQNNQTDQKIYQDLEKLLESL